MRSLRVVTLLFGLGALLGGGAGAGSAREAAPDARQRVVVTAAARDSILTEMRAMLEAVHGILHGLAANDPAVAAKAARAVGMAAAADTEPEIKRQLPPAFLQLGMQTHASFDRLADRLGAGGRPEELLGAVAGVTSHCVACHGAYRFDVR